MIVNYGAQNITGAVLLDVSGHPEETSMCELIEKQIKKGWFHIFYGVLVAQLERGSRKISSRFQQKAQHLMMGENNTDICVEFCTQYMGLEE